MLSGNNIILYNTRIYEEEDLSPKEFFRRIKRVNSIRTSRRLAFTFYPTSLADLERNYRLWEFINGNFNALNDHEHKYFIVMVPQWLYLFLRYCTKEAMVNSIATALTGFYVARPEHRATMESQLIPEVMRKVKTYFHEHFSEFDSFVFIQSQDAELADAINDDYFEKRKQFISRFDYFFRDHCGNPIIIPYTFPIYDTRYHKTSIFRKGKFDLPLVNSYFTVNDWKKVVLQRGPVHHQSGNFEEEPWYHWKKIFVRENNFNSR